MKTDRLTTSRRRETAVDRRPSRKPAVTGACRFISLFPIFAARFARQKV
ncbi:hypothetical protein B4113_1973 [Geobacillus sp. B4113_201601]|nr:hypothetical protein B4113_1973 [Geobacillus sp. B4113_201601]